MSSLKLSLLALLIILLTLPFYFVKEKEDRIASRVCLESSTGVDTFNSVINFRSFHDSGNVVLTGSDNKKLCSDYSSNFIQTRNNRLETFEFSVPGNLADSKLYLEITKYHKDVVESTRQIDTYQLPGSSYHYLAINNDNQNVVANLIK